MKTLCNKCGSMCCRYVALPFETPDDQEGFDEVRWFLMHEGVTVFVTEGQWFFSVATPCKHLSPQGRCEVYTRRPRICRDYNDDGCDYQGGDYEYKLFFTHPEQIDAYAAKALAKKKRKRKKVKRGLPKR